MGCGARQRVHLQLECIRICIHSVGLQPFLLLSLSAHKYTRCVCMLMNKLAALPHQVGPPYIGILMRCMLRLLLCPSLETRRSNPGQDPASAVAPPAAPPLPRAPPYLPPTLPPRPPLQPPKLPPPAIPLGQQCSTEQVDRCAPVPLCYPPCCGHWRVDDYLDRDRDGSGNTQVCQRSTSKPTPTLTLTHQPRPSFFTLHSLPCPRPRPVKLPPSPSPSPSPSPIDPHTNSFPI